MESTKSIAELVADWRYIRSQSTDFIQALGDEGLEQKLARPGLDTFGKHFQEMIDVQTAYIAALTTGEMDFSGVAENDEYDGTETAQQLLERMREADERLIALAQEDDNTGVNVRWPEGEAKGLASHLANLCMHEAFHLGQLVGFCYAMKIPIPESVVASWALSPPEEVPSGS